MARTLVRFRFDSERGEEAERVGELGIWPCHRARTLVSWMRIMTSMRCKHIFISAATFHTFGTSSLQWRPTITPFNFEHGNMPEETQFREFFSMIVSIRSTAVVDKNAHKFHPL
jgi:hypothetical protein